MKYFVYVIYSEKYDKIYIGVTGNLEKRLFAHNNLPKGWTKNFHSLFLLSKHDGHS
jgi:putative endonuclease